MTDNAIETYEGEVMKKETAYEPILEETPSEQTENILLDYLEETAFVMKEQLKMDYKRKDKQWRKKMSDIEFDRIVAARLKTYIHDFENNGAPLPYGKILGLCHIAIVRINHPELLIEEEKS